MHVSIVEPDSNGHRFVYVKLLIERLHERGCRFTLITTPDALASADFGLHLTGVIPERQVHVEEAKAFGPGLLVKPGTRESDLVVIPGGDSFVSAWARRPWVARHGPPVRALVMRDPRWQRTERGHLPPGAWGKLGILSTAEVLIPGLTLLWLTPSLPVDRGSDWHRRPSTVMDPVILEESTVVIQCRATKRRNDLQMSSETFWFGMVGRLSARKNLPLVAEALSRIMPTAHRRIGLALLGPVASELKPVLPGIIARLKRAGIMIRFDDRVRSNLEVNFDLAALDAVIMAYSSHAPNSTMTKAGALGISLVAAGPPSVREFTKRTTGAPACKLDLNGLISRLTAVMGEDTPEAKIYPHYNCFADDLIGFR